MLSDFDNKGKKTGTKGKVATVISKDKLKKLKPMLTWIGLGKARVCPYMIFFPCVAQLFQLQWGPIARHVGYCRDFFFFFFLILLNYAITILCEI